MMTGEMMGDTVDIRLWGWDHERSISPPMPVRSLLFGELAKRANAMVEMFVSDLYHDAKWITEQINGPMSFYYGVRAFGGTSIGTNEKLISDFNDEAWKVDLKCVENKWLGNEWFVEFTRVK